MWTGSWKAPSCGGRARGRARRGSTSPPRRPRIPVGPRSVQVAHLELVPGRRPGLQAPLVFDPAVESERRASLLRRPLSRGVGWRLAWPPGSAASDPRAARGVSRGPDSGLPSAGREHCGREGRGGEGRGVLPPSFPSVPPALCARRSPLLRARRGRLLRACPCLQPESRFLLSALAGRGGFPRGRGGSGRTERDGVARLHSQEMSSGLGPGSSSFAGLGLCSQRVAGGCGRRGVGRGA